MTYSDRPILIASPTRSGTTLLAWGIHLHGVWIGEGKVTSAPETNPQVPTENAAIKKYLKGISGAPEGFREGLLALAQTDGPWLIKTAQTLMKQDAFLKHFPEALWLLPYRPVDDIVASAMRHPGMRKAGEAARRRIVAQHRALQGEVANKARYRLWVDADALAKGDLKEAEKVFNFIDIPFNRCIWTDWVQPERWNRARNGS